MPAIVDLSFPIRPHFRWKVTPRLVSSHAAGDLFQSTVLLIACHADLGDNGEVSAAELDAHAGHVRQGDIALLRTDWPRKVSAPRTAASAP